MKSSHFYPPLRLSKSKEGKTTLIETPPEVIGEGTYGCVHRPSLRCEKGKGTTRIDYKGKISKLGTKKTINEEMREYKLINNVDKSAIFYPGKPKDCAPMKDKPTLDAIDKCTDFKADRVDDYKMLIIKDGGENLQDFARRISSRVETPNVSIARESMERFWIETHRMFLGLAKFWEAGIVHHDLKHKNVVYNEKLNRINFIDFGLMTTADLIRKESKKSEYGFSIRHWSFPPETLFLNYDDYIFFAGTEPQEKSAKTNEKTIRQKEFLQFLGEIKDSNSHVYTIFEITDPDFQEKKQDSFAVQQHTNEYYRMVMHSLTKDNYKDFLEKSISTIDSYGLATGLIYVLNKTRHLINEKLADDLYNLFFNMMNFNVMERLSLDDAMIQYEDILQNSKLLYKYHMHFENHILISDDTEPESKHALKTITIPTAKIPDSRLESDPVSQCPPSSTFNKTTRKCVRVKRQRSKKSSSSKTKRAKLTGMDKFSTNL